MNFVLSSEEDTHQLKARADVGADVNGDHDLMS